MAKILDLIYRVKDSASVPIKNIKGAQDGFNLSLKDGIKIATAAAGAFTTVGTTVVKLIGEYQDFTIAAGELAQKIGTTTEEASALIEIADDLAIPLSSLETAFRTMAKQGIEPSIAGLITVREKLDAAATPAERMALATELLGKAGGDLLPMFEQLTNEQLADYITTMGDAKTVTDEEFEAALRNREAIDFMTDAYDSLKLSVGGFLAEGLIPYVEILRAIPDLLDIIIPRMQELAQSLLTMPAASTLPSPGRGGRMSPGQTIVVTPGANTYREHGRASGGEVGSGGDSYVVGERGPEVFTPRQPGYVSSNSDLAGLTTSLDRMIKTLPTILRDAVERSK